MIKDLRLFIEVLRQGGRGIILIVIVILTGTLSLKNEKIRLKGE